MTNVDNEEETKLLQSEIWTTLFRGGYMTGKLQRSLSGYHVSDVCFLFFVFFVKITLLNAIVNFESLIGQPDRFPILGFSSTQLCNSSFLCLHSP